MTALAALFSGAFLLSTAAPVAACPNCKAVVADASSASGEGVDAANPAEPPALAKGYNYSILYMIGSMYVVLGGMGAMGFYYFRKHAPNINDVGR